MLEFHRVTRCPTWAAEASPCAGTSMPCNPIVPEVPFGGGLLSVISPLLPLGEVDDGVSISTLWTRKRQLHWLDQERVLCLGRVEEATSLSGSSASAC